MLNQAAHPRAASLCGRQCRLKIARPRPYKSLLPVAPGELYDPPIPHVGIWTEIKPRGRHAEVDFIGQVMEAVFGPFRLILSIHDSVFWWLLNPRGGKVPPPKTESWAGIPKKILFFLCDLCVKQKPISGERYVRMRFARDLEPVGT